MFQLDKKENMVLFCLKNRKRSSRLIRANSTRYLDPEIRGTHLKIIIGWAVNGWLPFENADRKIANGFGGDSIAAIRRGPSIGDIDKGAGEECYEQTTVAFVRNWSQFIFTPENR